LLFTVYQDFKNRGKPENKLLTIENTLRFAGGEMGREMG